MHAVCCLSLCLTGHWVFRHAVSETRRVLIPSPLCGPWAISPLRVYGLHVRKKALRTLSVFLVFPGFQRLCLLSAFFLSLPSGPGGSPTQRAFPSLGSETSDGHSASCPHFALPAFPPLAFSLLCLAPYLVTLPWPRVTPVPRLWLPVLSPLGNIYPLRTSAFFFFLRVLRCIWSLLQVSVFGQPVSSLAPSF